MCKERAQQTEQLETCSYTSVQRPIKQLAVAMQHVVHHSSDCHMESTKSFVRRCSFRVKMPRSIAAVGSLSASLLAFRFPSTAAADGLPFAERTVQLCSDSGCCRRPQRLCGACGDDASWTPDLRLAHKS